MIRRMVKTGLAEAAASSSGMGHFLRMFSRFRNGPVILAYHRVVKDFQSSAETSIPAMLVTRATLEKHLDALAEHYRLISLDELGARMESKRGFDEPMAAITFDDGYRDFYENAYPVLKRKGVPAALFVVTSTVGTDELHLHDKLYLLLLTRFRQEGWTSSKLSNFLHSLGIWIPQIKAGDAYHATRALLQQLSRGEIARIIR